MLILGGRGGHGSGLMLICFDHERSKHINIKFHFIRGQVKANNICLNYCPIENMIADLLTK